MYKIGLTGGIACGKTTIGKFLREAGAVIIDADAIAHALALPGEALWQAYYEHFGKKVLSSDNTLNRRMIGNIVFNDSKEKAWINAISHPLIWQEIEKKLNILQQQGEKIAVIDVPLLFETGWNKNVDEIWVVYIDKKTQIERLRQRNNYTYAEARQRIRSQMSLQQKMQMADRVIDTGNVLAANRKNTQRLWRSLKKRLGFYNE